MDPVQYVTEKILITTVTFKIKKNTYLSLFEFFRVFKILESCAFLFEELNIQFSLGNNISFRVQTLD